MAPPPTPRERPSAAIHVCPLRLVPATVAATGARHLLSVINQQQIPPTPAGIAPDDHLRIAVNDIAVPQDGLVHPSSRHIDAIVAFARRWNHTGPVVVHCLAGISRSTAATFIMLCDLNPKSPEAWIAAQIRAASPTAMPNALMIELADQVLGRRGRMIAAIQALAPAGPAMEGIPFALPADLD